MNLPELLHLAETDWILLACLKDFLEKFDDLAKILSGSKYVTASQVMPGYQSLIPVFNS